MKAASLLFLAGLVAFGQNTGTTGTTNQNSGSGRSMTGVLLDASCTAIASRGTGSTGTRSRADAATGGSSASAGTGATSGGNSASALGTTGSAPQTSGVTTTGGNQASATQGTSEANMTGVTQAGRQSATAGVHGQTGATSGASSASAQGTTGAATTTSDQSGSSLRTHTANSSGVNQSGTQGSSSVSSQTRISGTATASASSGAVSGDRNRSAETGMTQVREKYRDCMATAKTTAFALHSNGTLYVLDQAGNDMVRQQMSGEAFRASMTSANGAPQWITVTVQGTANGENLAITSVRR